jgi:hypothetical protein
MSENVAAFFELGSLATLYVATIAVVVCSNTTRRLTGWVTIWIPFLWALLVVLVGAHYSGKLSNAGEFLVALVNSCLLFSCATGANETVVAIPVAVESAKKRESIRRPRGFGTSRPRWLSSWFTKGT